MIIFKMEMAGTPNKYRIYINDTSSDITNTNVVAKQYKMMRENQTYDYALRMKLDNTDRLQSGNGIQMRVIDAILELDDFYDLSDPDMSLSNVHHLFQTAESMRNAGKDEWFQLTGLIHDLGKIMFLNGRAVDGTSVDAQWGVVGDTYILGCRLQNDKVFPEFDELCPDMNDNKMNTKLGVYHTGHGIMNCTFTWGHDEYLYDVIKYNRSIGNVSDKFPIMADNIIRLHSLYPYHTYDKYSEFESVDGTDAKIKKYVQDFNKYDLYTKVDKKVNIEELKEYYVIDMS